MSYKIKIKTDWPVAVDSPDHLYPAGTKQDNSTKQAFIEDVEALVGKKTIQYMDFGCSGGLLVHDFLRKGHIAVGLEGSDYSVLHSRAEWPELHEKNLFTCDVTKPFNVTITHEGKEEIPFLCDVISAWEVVEHIAPSDLFRFFENVKNHLAIGGKFIASISIRPHPPVHQSIYHPEIWEKYILTKLPGLALRPYPFHPWNAVRYYLDSIYICLERIS